MIKIFIFFLLSLASLSVFFFTSCDDERIQEDPQIALGRKLFNDTKFDNLFGNTVSCATCHPGGDMDHKKWSLPPVSVDPVATPTLFGVMDTPPYLWLGEGGNDLKELTRIVIDSILKGSASEEELEALAAYQQSLAVPANPWRNSDGSLTTQQESGKLIFENQGKCIVCHSGEAFTGRFKIQIKPLSPQVDVPSLRWIFATAPYFRDHSVATLRGVVDRYADSVTTTQMTTWGWNGLGISDINLTEQEKADLIEYLKTL
jgi:cytochrome c peroxidase